MMRIAFQQSIGEMGCHMSIGGSYSAKTLPALERDVTQYLAYKFKISQTCISPIHLVHQL